MGPIERELRRFCRDYERDVCKPLNTKAARFYVGSVGSLVEQLRCEPDTWEECMSEAIEAAEALGL